MMSLTGQKIDIKTTLLAVIADRLGVLAWQNTKDGQKGLNMPESILQNLIGNKKESNTMSFNSGDEYEAYRRSLLNGRRD